MTVRITHIGGPTALIEVGEWRLLTHPTFDPRPPLHPVPALIGAPPTTEVVMSTTVETANEIRPFQVDIPDEALDDLRRASPRRAGPARSW
jgi:hypothetical protein